MNIEHTKMCLQAQAEDEAYDRDWPHSCGHCGGSGYITSSYDPSPAGVSLSPGSFEEEDPCEHCLFQGKCPRCANIVWTFISIEELPDFLTCFTCRWKKGEPGRPNYECSCWEAAYAQAEREYVREMLREE